MGMWEQELDSLRSFPDQNHRHLMTDFWNSSQWRGGRKFFFCFCFCLLWWLFMKQLLTKLAHGQDCFVVPHTECIFAHRAWWCCKEPDRQTLFQWFLFFSLDNHENPTKFCRIGATNWHGWAFSDYSFLKRNISVWTNRQPMRQFKQHKSFKR